MMTDMGNSTANVVATNAANNLKSNMKNSSVYAYASIVPCVPSTIVLIMLADKLMNKRFIHVHLTASSMLLITVMSLVSLLFTMMFVVNHITNSQDIQSVNNNLHANSNSKYTKNTHNSKLAMIVIFAMIPACAIFALTLLQALRTFSIIALPSVMFPTTIITSIFALLSITLSATIIRMKNGVDATSILTNAIKVVENTANVDYQVSRWSHGHNSIHCATRHEPLNSDCGHNNNEHNDEDLPPPLPLQHQSAWHKPKPANAAPNTILDGTQTGDVLHLGRTDSVCSTV